MNKIYRIASATLVGVLLLLTLGSCSKESPLTPEAQPETGAGQLAFSLDNDALRSIPAEAYEKAVDEHSVWCVFVTPTGAGGAQTVQAAKQAHKTAAGSYSVNAGFAGAAQMFVIGNVESELQSKLYNLTSGTPLSQVQSWIVKNSLGNGTADPAKFVMTSEMLPVNLPAKGAPAANLPQAIQLKRLAARFDVINEVPGLKLTTVTVANRIVTSTLLNVHQTGEKAATATEYNITDGKVLLHKIYSYQNSHEGGTEGATTFTLKGKYNGKEIKPIQVELQDASDVLPLEVKRNHCYRILLKPTGDDFKPIKPDDPSTAWRIVVKVLDWNEAADLGNYSDEDLANQGDVIDPTVNPTGINLLDAVAEYNLDATGTQFVTTHSNEEGISGYFSWDDAMALKIPAGYHLPTKEEWIAILGSAQDIYSDVKNDCFVYFNRDATLKNLPLTVQIPGQTGTVHCLQDVKQVKAESATYMIRYRYNETYRSAWRYSYVDGPIAGQNVLKIESVTVKDNLTIDQLSEAYFAKPGVKEYVKTRYFPTTGGIVVNDIPPGFGPDFGWGSVQGRNDGGLYWSSTKFKSRVPVSFGGDYVANEVSFDKDRACVTACPVEYRRTVRLFHNSWQGTQR